ncbi:MAG: hypothetical protein ACR2PA_20640 [Hyphomicrobiaceae bacterium]
MSSIKEIRANIEIVEEAYEYMLAYAAQGRTDEGAGPDGAHIRSFVARFADAAEAMAPDIAGRMDAEIIDCSALQGSFQRDSDIVVVLLRLLLSRDNMTSEMIDNTNGMIVMRSYLTTLFYIDKVLLPPETAAAT